MIQPFEHLILKFQKGYTAHTAPVKCCTKSQAAHWLALSLQVDLGFLRFVSAIGTQGAISQETRRTYFVKSYKVDVSSNGEDWITLKEGSKQKVGKHYTNLKTKVMAVFQSQGLHFFVFVCHACYSVQDLCAHFCNSDLDSFHNVVSGLWLMYTATQHE